jgi:hypothetical protein
MTYNGSAQRFTYRWKTGSHRTGTVNLDIQLTSPSASTLQERITISHRKHRSR